MSAITLWRPRRDLLSLSKSLDRFFDDRFLRPRRLWLVPSWSEGWPWTCTGKTAIW